MCSEINIRSLWIFSGVGMEGNSWNVLPVMNEGTLWIFSGVGREGNSWNVLPVMNEGTLWVFSNALCDITID